MGWLGELLTETCNPGVEKPIGASRWNEVCGRAIYSEWNNTVWNLVRKARKGYLPHVSELFLRSDIRFSLDAEQRANTFDIDDQVFSAQQLEMLQVIPGVAKLRP